MRAAIAASARARVCGTSPGEVADGESLPLDSAAAAAAARGEDLLLVSGVQLQRVAALAATSGMKARLVTTPDLGLAVEVAVAAAEAEGRSFPSFSTTAAAAFR